MAPQLQYSRLAEPDPNWAAVQPAVDDEFDKFWALPHDEFVQAYQSMPAVFPEDTPQDLEIDHRKISVRDGHQIQLRIYRNPNFKVPKQDAPLYLIFHGGGWILGSHEVEEGTARWVAKETGAVVVDVDYRLAPEYKYPYAVNDCFDAFKWCKQNAALLEVDPTRIIVGGSSAGGNLTAVVAQMARDQNEAGIIGQVLNFPVICHPNHFPRNGEYEYDSWDQNAEASILNKDRMMRCWDSYYPEAGADVHASPFLATSLEGLPRALIQIAGMDPLRDEAFAYADKLKGDGVEVDIQTWPGLPHGFFTLPMLPAASAYFKTSAAWVKKVLAADGWTI